MRHRTLELALLAVAIVFLSPRDAAAYLDPGSGSMIFQAAIAALAGVAYGVRIYWGKIRSLFGRKRVEPGAKGHPSGGRD
jgi:hypothetical protein